jgi:uncharacterized protein
MSSNARRVLLCAFCAIAAAAPVCAQAAKDSLATLIQTGNRKAALEKIRAGADVNEAQPDGTRPIHWAVYHVDYELLDALIARKAKADVTNQFGATPIAEAAKLGDARLVKTLLAAGAGPEGANEDGQTALMLAVKTGELPVVAMLIQAGANVNAVENFRHQTPLMWAAAANRNAGEMVKLLLAKGADVKPRALYTDWPSQITNEPRAQYRPVGGLTAMLYAARNGCSACADELAAAGADVNLPTPEGVTPLMLALDNGHNEVAKLLLDRGANPNVWDWWGRTPLYIAVDHKESAATPGGRGGTRAGRARGGAANRATGALVSSMEIIQALLAANVDPNPQLTMHRPSPGGNSGRFIDPLLNTGCTPLVRATMAGDEEVMLALLAKGASPNINDMGVTAFLVAAGVGTGGGGTGLAAQTGGDRDPNLPLMDLLLQHGADINARVTGTKTYSMRITRASSDNEGKSALHTAVQQARPDVVRFLLDKGINPDFVDSEGHKAIDLIGVGSTKAGGVKPPSGTPATAAAIREMLQSASARR